VYWNLVRLLLRQLVRLLRQLVGLLRRRGFWAGGVTKAYRDFVKPVGAFCDLELVGWLRT
jgi:hypothetical protein